MHIERKSWLVLLLALALGACASRGQVLDRLTADELFAYGMERLERRAWSDAISAFERLPLVFPNHPRAAESRFRLGEAYMGRREYITAAMEFNRLATELPGSPWADDARFGVCRAYRQLSPAPPRDQQYTVSALEHCRSLVSYYPDSEYVPEAQEIIVLLTDRLAEKEFDTAEYYFRRRAYHSANIYYEAVATEYSTTGWAPRALLRLHESYTRLGYDQEARAARERLLREFPASPQAQQLSGATTANRS